MKFVGAATYKDGGIVVDNPGDLAMYKNSLTPGARLRMTIEPLPAKRSDQAMRLFYALVDVYRKENDIDKERAKADFKLAYGVAYPVVEGLDTTRHGQIADLGNGYFEFLVSLNEYTVEEMYNLLRGTVNACLDAQANIESEILQWRAFNATEA